MNEHHDDDAQWHDRERVIAYAERVDLRAEETRPQLEMIAKLLPYEPQDAFRFVDLGAGPGTAALPLLTAFPASSATLVDFSEEMRRVALERLAAFGPRVDYLVANLQDGLPAGMAGPYEVMVSCRFTHHLRDSDKLGLFRQIVDVLTPGGCFVNCDMITPSEEAVRDVNAAVAAKGQPAASAATGHDGPGSQPHLHTATVDQHIAWLREAGLVAVDCYWKYLGTAIMAGFKPKS